MRIMAEDVIDSLFWRRPLKDLASQAQSGMWKACEANVL